MLLHALETPSLGVAQSCCNISLQDIQSLKAFKTDGLLEAFYLAS